MISESGEDIDFDFGADFEDLDALFEESAEFEEESFEESSFSTTFGFSLAEASAETKRSVVLANADSEEQFNEYLNGDYDFASIFSEKGYAEMYSSVDSSTANLAAKRTSLVLLGELEAGQWYTESEVISSWNSYILTLQSSASSGTSSSYSYSSSSATDENGVTITESHEDATVDGEVVLDEDTTIVEEGEALATMYQAGSSQTVTMIGMIALFIAAAAFSLKKFRKSAQFDAEFSEPFIPREV